MLSCDYQRFSLDQHLFRTLSSRILLLLLSKLGSESGLLIASVMGYIAI